MRTLNLIFSELALDFLLPKRVTEVKKCSVQDYAQVIMQDESRSYIDLTKKLNADRCAELPIREDTISSIV